MNRIFYFLCLILLNVGCTKYGENNPQYTFSIEGRLYFDEDHPVANQTVYLNLTALGDGLFAGSSSCDDPVQHMPGEYNVTVETDVNGSFQIDLSIRDFGSMARNSESSNSCQAEHGNIFQITNLSVFASVLADTNNCQSYCDASPKSSIKTCESTCITGSRRLISQTSLTQAQISPEIVTDMPINSLGFAITPGGVDLAMDENSAAASATIETVNFEAGSCNVLEECVRAPGDRKLLRFDGVIMNLGDTAIILGDPGEHPELFEFSSCHGHYHSRKMVNYELVDPNTHTTVVVGASTLIGRKQGYCLTDARQVAGSTPAEYSSCTFMALSSGWADVYASALDCQWLDITDVPSGDYLLRLTVNPENFLTEVNYANNVTESSVVIP